MNLRSLPDLDSARSWKRLLHWARNRMEVPDRLPFELVARIFPDGPTLEAAHHVQPLQMVMGTKGGGTARPFARVPVIDLLLYQALVDQLAEEIETALLPRDQVFAYRQNADLDQEDQFAGSPRWEDFNNAARARLAAGLDAYTVRADISGYFTHIDVSELERSLLERGSRGGVARDLGELLRSWAALGIHGLPQGVAPSSPLGNFFLVPIDEALSSQSVDFVRYMDDISVFADSYDETRQAQDLLERELYDLGLSLSGDKSRISHRRTELDRSRPARELVEAHQELFREGWAAIVDQDYADPEEVPADRDIDAAAVLDLYQDLVAQLRDGSYPEGFRPLLRSIYRELSAGGDTTLINEAPWIVERFPDLTRDAARYVGTTARHDLASAREAFAAMLDPDRFHREFELLTILRSVLLAPQGELALLAGRFGTLAIEHFHPVVRARALLAWGAHSGDTDLGVADAFWRRAKHTWRPYPFVAIQSKRMAERNERYDQWSGEGRLLAQIGSELRHAPFSWRGI